MLPKFILLFFLLLSRSIRIECEDHGFIYKNFTKASSLVLDGVANIIDGGLLRLTGIDVQASSGRAFYYKPFAFKNSSSSAEFSFSTTFVFAIVPKNNRPSPGAHGFTFVIAPTSKLRKANDPRFLGLFNKNNNGNSSNHIVAVEFDTIQNPRLGDINDNHVGIDINGLPSVKSAPASYNAGTKVKNLTLKSGDRMQVWIDYDGSEKLLNVTISPIFVTRPKIPLLSLHQDISPVLKKSMYVGFSASTGKDRQSSHYILGWSFKMNRSAQELNLSSLPLLPEFKPESRPQNHSRVLKIGLPVTFFALGIAVLLGTFFTIQRRKRYAEVLEDWEKIYGPHRFSYKDLYVATKGFHDKELLGKGGFGRVYRGVLRSSDVQIAVKRVSQESRQGIKEFVAEIVTLGQLKHRNLVQLLGYCRRKDELLLVYDYMPNGSLDKLLFGFLESKLSWEQRFNIIKGVATGLLYLHEEWDQVVIHRDIKSSNVLLDNDFNGRLSDFGLARLYDHGENPETTHVAGTRGYLAPEMARTRKATTATDVYSFGAFVLEVACGRRPTELLESNENIIFLDWVITTLQKGEILETVDPKLGSEYVTEEIELVLKLGLLCLQTDPIARPNMRKIVKCLEMDFSQHDLSHVSLAFGEDERSFDFPLDMINIKQILSIAD